MNEIETTLNTVPHSLTMEQAVISGLLTGDGWDDVSGILTEHDFYSPRHAVMFRGVAAMSSSGHPVDPLMLLEWLVSNQLDMQAGGEAYLGELVRSSPATTINLKSYAAHVRGHVHQAAIVHYRGKHPRNGCRQVPRASRPAVRIGRNDFCPDGRPHWIWIPHG